MHNISFNELSRQIDSYSLKKKEYAYLGTLYKEVLEVQFEYMKKIDMSFVLSPEEIQDSFRQRRYLLQGETLPIDPDLFCEIVLEISRAVARANPSMSRELDRLIVLDDWKGDNLKNFLRREEKLNPEGLQLYLQEKEIDRKTGLEIETILFVFFMALVPFYVNYAQKVASRTDFNLWKQGRCPVCGQKPGMAMLRSEDNARILECGLCRTRWDFPRLECPFCDNRDFKKLNYFYLEEDKSRRVYVCEKCKSYLKTINAKDMGKIVNLELEDLFTVQLDMVAQEKGYNPGEGLLVLM